MSHEMDFHTMYDRTTINEAKKITDPIELESYKYHRWKHKKEALVMYVGLQKEKAELLKEVRVREDIPCGYCGMYMISTFKYAMLGEVIVGYKCPKAHLPGITMMGDTIMSHNTSSDDTSLPEAVIEEEINEEERRKYCYTDKEGLASPGQYLDCVLNNLIVLKDILQQEPQREIVVNDTSIFAIKKKLTRVLRNKQYSDLLLKQKPHAEVTTFEFAVLDLTARGEKQSFETVADVIHKALCDTNWMLYGDLRYKGQIIRGKIRIMD